MSERPPEDERSGDEADEDENDDELPPPATWAGRRSQQGEEAPGEPPEEVSEEPEPDADEPADEQIGAGITDEFALDDEAPEEPPADEPPAGEPPVEEPPEAEPPEPIEEPHAPEAPPSAEAEEEAETAAEKEEQPAGDPAAPGREAEEAAGIDVAEGDDSGEEAGEAGDAAGSDVEPEASEPVTVVAPSPGPKVAASTADEKLEKDGKPPRAGLWPRFIAASFIIVVSMATATAASFLLYLTDIAKGLGGLPGLEEILPTVEGGEPQTVLILGSDIRPDIEEKGRSDTTMLLRLDPDKNVLSLLSLPRDLQVNIPGYGVGKLNDAYFNGGPKKTTEVVSQLTGLEINHVVNIDFAGFAEAVNAIECVFIDVDRDYFNTNDDAISQEDYYSEIDIDAGYQQLCGFKALQYVRYRHDDNDLVRAARQQSFLREARQKVPPERLFTKRKEFIRIFTKYTTSDVDDPIAMLDTLKLFIELRDAPVRRIEFQGDIGGPNDPYVTASSEQIKAAVQQFLGEKPTAAEQASQDGDGGGGDGDGGGGDKGGDGGGGDGDGGGEDGPALIEASDAAERYALQFDGKLRFPVIAPVRLKPGSQYSDESRAYTIDTYDGEHYPSYKLVFPLQSQFGVPEYYGVMGTKWDRPPILENPSETRQIGDRKYLLFYEGDRLQVVGFKTPRGSYWVSNTLTGTLSEEEMLGIAESMKPFSPER